MVLYLSETDVHIKNCSLASGFFTTRLTIEGFWCANANAWWRWAGMREHNVVVGFHRRGWHFRLFNRIGQQWRIHPLELSSQPVQFVFLTLQLTKRKMCDNDNWCNSNKHHLLSNGANGNCAVRPFPKSHLQDHMWYSAQHSLNITFSACFRAWVHFIFDLNSSQSLGMMSGRSYMLTCVPSSSSFASCISGWAVFLLTCVGLNFCKETCVALHVNWSHNETLEYFPSHFKKEREIWLIWLRGSLTNNPDQLFNKTVPDLPAQHNGTEDQAWCFQTSRGPSAVWTPAHPSLALQCSPQVQSPWSCPAIVWMFSVRMPLLFSFNWFKNRPPSSGNRRHLHLARDWLWNSHRQKLKINRIWWEQNRNVQGPFGLTATQSLENIGWGKSH